MKTIRILLAEDHKLIRETWTAMLNMDERFQVIAACDNTTDAIAIARKELPDIILMDINIFPMNGFQATTLLTETVPLSKVIALTFHSELGFSQKMFAAGAKGYITKNSGYGELVDAIIQVHEGSLYICAEMRGDGIEVAPTSQPEGPVTQPLTNKEIQVSHFMLDGLRTKEIAGKLNISTRTVGVHRYNIFKKLNVNSSISLVSLLNSWQGYGQYAAQKCQEQ